MNPRKTSGTTWISENFRLFSGTHRAGGALSIQAAGNPQLTLINIWPGSQVWGTLAPARPHPVVLSWLPNKWGGMVRERHSHFHPLPTSCKIRPPTSPLRSCLCLLSTILWERAPSMITEVSTALLLFCFHSHLGLVARSYGPLLTLWTMEEAWFLPATVVPLTVQSSRDRG